MLACGLLSVALVSLAAARFLGSNHSQLSHLGDGSGAPARGGHDLGGVALDDTAPWSGTIYLDQGVVIGPAGT